MAYEFYLEREILVMPERPLLWGYLANPICADIEPVHFRRGLYRITDDEDRDAVGPYWLCQCGFAVFGCPVEFLFDEMKRHVDEKHRPSS